MITFIETFPGHCKDCGPVRTLKHSIHQGWKVCCSCNNLIPCRFGRWRLALFQETLAGKETSRLRAQALLATAAAFGTLT
jgi:hypothetical protein